MADREAALAKADLVIGAYNIDEQFKPTPWKFREPFADALERERDEAEQKCIRIIDENITRGEATDESTWLLQEARALILRRRRTEEG